MQSTPVHLNKSKHRFERTTDGKVSFVEFRQDDEQTLALTHTEVHPDLEGQGIGSRLVKEVLDQIREKHLQVLPYCPFIAVFIKRHPDYQDLVSPDFTSED